MTTVMQFDTDSMDSKTLLEELPRYINDDYSLLRFRIAIINKIRQRDSLTQNDLELFDKIIEVARRMDAEDLDINPQSMRLRALGAQYHALSQQLLERMGGE